MMDSTEAARLLEPATDFSGVLGAPESDGTSGLADSCIGICEAPDGLGAIRKPDMELVIWRRALPLRFRTWLDRLDPSQIPDLRVLVQPKDLRRAVKPHLDDCDMPPGAMRDLLIGDIAELVSAYARITKSDLVDVRLERISHDACWKFHRDCVAARLLTTYRGPVTQWVQPRHAEQALREQRDYAGPIEALNINDVAIFKGSCAGPGGGIVHRSPPIAGSGRTRLLLCLNQQSASSPEP